MAESIFMRVQRLFSASVEDTVDQMERAGGTAVMREAVREVDRAVDSARGEHEAVVAKRLHAERQRRMARERLGTLEEKAVFALGEGRDDLAEAAVTRQIDMEREIARLETVEADAREEAGRLEEALAALEARRERMMEELEAFEHARREAAQMKAEAPRGSMRSRAVERAEAAFERAMDGAGGAAGVTRADGRVAAGLAELGTLERSAAVRERLAQLRSRAA